MVFNHENCKFLFDSRKETLVFTSLHILKQMIGDYQVLQAVSIPHKESNSSQQSKDYIRKRLAKKSLKHYRQKKNTRQWASLDNIGRTEKKEETLFFQRKTVKKCFKN